jgi:hypothetical protein
MVRIIVDRPFEGGKNYIEAAGLSTDAKPTGTIITGSMFLEVDTGKVKSYDEVGDDWTQIGG